jgi:hypothetical protein
LDLFERVQPVEARGVLAESLPRGLGPSDVLEEMVLVTARGRVLKGFDACRWMAARLPALAWSLPLWYLPGVAFAGRRLIPPFAHGRSAPAGRRADDAWAVEQRTSPP